MAARLPDCPIQTIGVRDGCAPLVYLNLNLTIQLRLLNLATACRIARFRLVRFKPDYYPAARNALNVQMASSSWPIWNDLSRDRFGKF